MTKEELEAIRLTIDNLDARLKPLDTFDSNVNVLYLMRQAVDTGQALLAEVERLLRYHPDPCLRECCLHA